MAARGDGSETTEDEPQAAEPERRGGLLSRIFPPAPPLHDKPDPLRGFDPAGSMRPVRERAFLLRANVWAWVPTGIVAFLGFYGSFFYRDSIFALIATFVQFGALIAAGWFGWQRPTLYGVAAGVLSGVLTTIIVFIEFAQSGAGPDAFGGPAVVAADGVVTILYQAAFGFLGGWYGGYLRRRQAQVNRDLRSRR